MPRLILWRCLLVFFLSGASALTYEILWQREMYLVFGASAPATTAILTAIFLGIAFGSQMAVPLLRRSKSPFKLYAALELVMGVWGLVVPYAMQLSDRLYVASVHAMGEGHELQVAIRFVLAIVPLLPATLAMGGTIPVMIRCVAEGSSSKVGLVYGINVLGAVIGCLLTGLFWIKELGLNDSRYVAVGLNLAAFAIIFPVRKYSPERTASDSRPQALPPPSAVPISLAAYFLAGFIALGLEVVWLRFLGIVNSNSTVTFTLTLTIYLLGMGLGSLCVYSALKRYLQPRTIFRLANAGTALASLATFGVLYRAAGWNQEHIVDAAKRGTLTLAGIYQIEAWIIGSLMLLPTIFMGLVYPAVCDSSAASGALRDRWVGRSYFMGTLGSVAGILLVGSVLIPQLGLHLVFGLLVACALAICLFTAGPASHSLRPIWIPVACLAGLLWAGSVSFVARPVLKETVASRRDGKWVEVSVENPDRVISELTRMVDGQTATVYVKKDSRDGAHLVYVDDQLVASTNLAARVDALMLAHLPLLLHAHPENALTVGFGTGGTSYALTTHDVDAYCVEIEAEVPRSAYLMPEQNFSVLDHPKFTLMINDARDHLHAGTRAYDVIATDVTNLQYKQNGNLYTVDYFQLMKSKLKPGGIACAWIPMAAIDGRELKILMRGFQSVFPHASLWFMNHTHTNFGILIGTPGPLSVDYRRLQEGFAQPEVARNLELIGMTSPLQLIHCLHLDEEGYRTYCGEVPFHTDDRPILEFSSPISFYQYYETFRENLAETLQLRPTDFTPYVNNLPAEQKAEMESYRIASHCFCEVLVRFYAYLIDRERGAADRAIAALKEAIAFSQTGLQAWPEDTVREQFYINFFSEAQRWMEQRIQPQL